MYTVLVSGRKVKGLGATVTALGGARRQCRSAKSTPGNTASKVFHKKGAVFVLSVWENQEAAAAFTPEMPEAQTISYPSLRLPTSAQAAESWFEELNAE